MARHTIIQLHEMILQLWKQGKSLWTIASIVGVGKSTVNDFRTKYRSGYDLKDEHRSGGPRKTTVRVNKIICSTPANPSLPSTYAWDCYHVEISILPA